MVKVHVAVVGSGHWSRVHLAALSASAEVSRVTLVGRNEAALNALAGEFPVVDAISKRLDVTLNEPSVDVIDVVLPHHLHAEISLSALAAGKHVVCEKPAAMTLEQFDAVVDKAAQVDRRYLIVMNQLYNPVIQRVGELVRQGAIGRPFLLVENAFSDHGAFYRDPSNWRTRLATAGGGVLIDGGFHMVYKQLHWLASHGYPRWISAAADQLAVDPGGGQIEEQGEDFVSYTAGYDERLRISSSHAWTLAADVRHPRLGFIAGTEATLQLTGEEESPIILDRDGHCESVEASVGATSNIATMHACLQDYIASLATGRDPQHGSTELARRTLELILAVYKSGRSGHRIDLSD